MKKADVIKEIDALIAEHKAEAEAVQKKLYNAFDNHIVASIQPLHSSFVALWGTIATLMKLKENISKIEE